MPSYDYTIDGEKIVPTRVDGGLPKSAVGDLVAVGDVPTVALNPVYGFVPANGRTFTTGSGTADVVDRHFKCTTGTTAFSSGTVQSFRSVNFKTGL